MLMSEPMSLACATFTTSMVTYSEIGMKLLYRMKYLDKSVKCVT